MEAQHEAHPGLAKVSLTGPYWYTSSGSLPIRVFSQLRRIVDCGLPYEPGDACEDVVEYYRTADQESEHRVLHPKKRGGRSALTELNFRQRTILK